MNINFSIVVPADWNNEKKGEFLEDLVGQLMRQQRFEILNRVRFTGMEIDVLGKHKDNNQRVFVECKFHKEKIQANVLLALIGKANNQNVPLAYLYSTSELGKEARGVLEERKKSNFNCNPILSWLGPKEIAESIMELYSIEPPKLDNLNVPIERIGNKTLILTPTRTFFWIIEEIISGVPVKAYIRSITDNPELSPMELMAEFENAGMFSGLELIEEKNSSSVKQTNFPVREEETVSSVSTADSFDDYRPCRPEDFVGRENLQKQVWNFLTNVKNDATSTRIVCFVGPSGYGKSSVIVKLADRFRNIKWKNQIYMFPVDVRSARGPLFVAKAFRAAIQSAIDSEFLDLKDAQINLESTESLLSGSSVEMVLNCLKEQRKVLVVFFDQFEELFAKESLFSTFEQFRNLAYEVDSIQPNIVLGFSWRTGINLPEDHPAYYMWHELRDKRIEYRLSEFDSVESTKFITLFEKHLKKKLDRQLKRRLLEQSQGLPWLLKKLSIHIFDELRKGVSQSDLIARQLNVKPLFDEDLEPLTAEQNSCLKYIANNSPADFIDVTEKFGHEVLNQIYSARLVIKAGQKYAVYWDIFKEYLISGKVPSIPFTYIPQTELYSFLNVLYLLRHFDSIDIGTIADLLGYGDKTILNIVADLEIFMLIERAQSLPNSISIIAPLRDFNQIQLADHLYSQLAGHVFVKSLADLVQNSSELPYSMSKELFTSSYPANTFNAKTIQVYTQRLLKWLALAGIVELYENHFLYTPDGLGRQKGVVASLRRNRSGIFFCSSGPRQAIELLNAVVSNNGVSREKIQSDGLRNSVSDLTTLGLANSLRGRLLPSKYLREMKKKYGKSFSVEKVLVSTAKNSPFLKFLDNLESNTKDSTLEEKVNLLNQTFDKNCSIASGKRYITVGKTWLRFVSGEELRPSKKKS